MIGFTDGHSFFPIDFALLSGKKKVSNEELDYDKRPSGGKRLAESDYKMIDVSVQMIERALNCGIYATHVLMDKWFTSPKMIDCVQTLGIDVIGMVKNEKTKSLYNDRLYRLSDLFEKASKDYTNGAVISSISVELPSGHAVKIVFVQSGSPSFPLT
ncbi:hypothetical protein [Enterococcus sp. JM9B]|uniref:hypothetical protein n=1 Tax=Enterococcus sp. JM9B TaxID=1857216 RepID=UPI001374ACE5|nr:hypothetical protein [Enterococcus sp. JM9B]KAF1301594.1 hypothetical protein BAU16_08685 [Enterococcus sp. JM9B]